MTIHICTPEVVREKKILLPCYDCGRKRIHRVTFFEWYDPLARCLACEKAPIHLWRRSATWCGLSRPFKRTRDVLRSTCKNCREILNASWLRRRPRKTGGRK